MRIVYTHTVDRHGRMIYVSELPNFWRSRPLLYKNSNNNNNNMIIIPRYYIIY